MKIFGYDFPDMLIKVSEKREYLEDLCAGKVYMNESGYFRKLEDTFRGDKFDGKCPISFENHLGEFMEFGPVDEPENRVKIPLECVSNFTMGFSGDNKIPLYCCSELSEAILLKESDGVFKFREEFISEMKQFGKYFAIFSKNEFVKHMYDYVVDKSYGAKWGSVAYVDIHSEYNTDILKDEYRNQYDVFFKKDKSYIWQTEWRILLVSNNAPIIGEDENFYIANIKPLSWFYISEISELEEMAVGVREN